MRAAYGIYVGVDLALVPAVPPQPEDYNLPYVTAAVLTFIGALAIFPVKKVK